MPDRASGKTERASVRSDIQPTVRQFVLDVVEGPRAGIRWTSQGERCTIGSRPSNDFVIADKTVSGFHCEIRVEGQRAWVRDLDSRNGTRVDGVLVREARLRDGSLMRLGRSTVHFQLVEGSAPIPLSPNDHFGHLVGRSMRMRATFHMLERAAETDSTVLILGETGSGKDAAAEAIHQASSRSEGPFVVVDCSAVAAGLIESELFGHQKGAFTDAVQNRIGAFEAASGGTLFLDEVGELPAELQPKLLRVLEQRTIRRLGSHEQRPVDVRIIAATNRDLRQEVNRGRFRPDLYYRLAVIEVHMPALRERPDDIPLIVQTIVRDLDADPVAVEELVTPELLRQLQSAAWPGNVRELRNYLERGLVLHQPLRGPEQAPADPDRCPVDASLSLATAKRQVLDWFEHQYVEALLERHAGNVTHAARAADVSRVYLHRLLRRHGLRG